MENRKNACKKWQTSITNRLVRFLGHSSTRLGKSGCSFPWSIEPFVYAAKLETNVYF